MKNRIHCHKINNLSNDDQNEINQLFIKWLDATQLNIITNQTQPQNREGFSFFLNFFFKY